MKRLVLAWIFVSVAGACVAQAERTEPREQSPPTERPIPYTLDDRDRAVRTEAKLDQFIAEANRRFDDLEEQNGRLVMGALAVLVVFMGFIIWDRRTTATSTLHPFRKELDQTRAQVDPLHERISQLNALVERLQNRIAELEKTKQ